MKKLLFILFFPVAGFGQSVSYASSEQTATAATNYTLGSTTYTAGVTYFFLIEVRKASGNPTSSPTITSSLTLTKINSFAGSQNNTMIIYRATPSSNTTTTVNFDFGETCTSFIRGTYQGTMPEGTTYEVSSNSGNGANPSINFVSYPLGTYIGLFTNNRNPFNATPEAGLTENDDSGNAVPIGRYLCHRNLTNDASINLTSTAATWSGIGVQIVAPRRKIMIQ